MKIDFVSDVACPWCAIGLAELERAIGRFGDEVPIELHFQPFELNPDMPPAGEELLPYLSRKYGSSKEEIAERQAQLRSRAADAGLHFGPREHVWNTFDAHRLLYWAGIEGHQLALKRALLAAYHERGENPGAHDVLLRTAEAAGMDVARAREVLDRDEYADEVRAQIAHWKTQGINSVPSLVIDDRYLIQGGQTAEVFEQALRRIGAESAAH